MSETIAIKAITVKNGRDGQGRVEVKLENAAAAPAPPALAIVYFHDREGRIRDRISIRVPAFKPRQTQSVSTYFRLKDPGFFSYTAAVSPREEKA